MPIRLNDLETAFRLRMDEAVKSLDRTVEGVEKAEKATERLQDRFDSLSGSGAKLAAGGAVITAAFGLAAKAADDQRVLYDGLRATVEATGNSYADQEPRIMQFLGALQETSRFGDTDFIPTFNRILLATGDVDKAMRGTRIAANLASAGFGKMEGTGNTLLQVFEGNVEAAAKFIPQLKNTGKFLQEGATRAELAEEALAKLEGVSANFPPPTGVNLYTKSLGDLQEAVGDVILDAVDPLFRRLDRLNLKSQELAQGNFGRITILATAFGGAVALLGGTLLIFIGQVGQAIIVLTGAGGLSGAMGIVTGSAAKLALALGSASALSLGIVSLAGVVTLAIVELNKLSKAVDEIDEGIRRADNLPKFRAELAAIRGTLRQLEEGTISASDATEEFNRFGVESVEQAQQRVRALDGIVERLEAQRDLEKDISGQAAAPAPDLGAGDFQDTLRGQADTVARTVKELEKEESAIRDVLFAFDQGTASAEEAQNRLTELGFQSRDAAQQRLLALSEEIPLQQERRTILESVRDLEEGEIAQKTEVAALLDDDLEKRREAVEIARGLRDEQGELLPPITEQISLAEDMNAEWEAFKGNIASSVAPVTNLTGIFQKRLPGIVGQSGDVLFNLGVGLVTGVGDSAAASAAFFKQLLVDLAKAIVQAVILKGVLSTLGGGPVGGILGGLFADPLSDQLARFEGSRFLDLFAQGLESAASQQTDSGRLAELSGDGITSSSSPGFVVEVNEATPETWTRITDEEIEPRTRELQAQRTGVAPSQGAL